MPSNAIAALGLLVKIGDGATPEVFTTIAELFDITGPSFSLDVADVTNQVSTGNWEEALPTVIRSGEVTFDIGFIPTNATHSQSAGLIADLKNRTKRNFQFVFPDTGATLWSFAAFVTGFEPAGAVADALRASVTLKITGQPTLAG